MRATPINYTEASVTSSYTVIRHSILKSYFNGS